MPETTKEQPKAAGLSLTEGLPLGAVLVGQKLRYRIGLTTTAIQRGKELAKEAKPILQENTDMAVEIEDAMGRLRTNSVLEAIKGSNKLMKQHMGQVE